MQKSSLAVVSVVVVLAGIVIAAVALGTLFTTNPGDDPTPQVTATGTATLSATMMATDTPTSEPETTAAPQTPTVARSTQIISQLNRTRINGHVTSSINDARDSRGLQPLDTDATTVSDLETMAGGHSESMADAGVASHEVNGTASSGRYNRHGLDDRCGFTSNSGAYVVTSNHNRLEVVELVDVEDAYHSDVSVDELERTIAEQVVEKFFDRDQLSTRLLYENANYMGAGVALDDGNNAYFTVNIC